MLSKHWEVTDVGGDFTNSAFSSCLENIIVIFPKTEDGQNPLTF